MDAKLPEPRPAGLPTLAEIARAAGAEAAPAASAAADDLTRFRVVLAGTLAGLHGSYEFTGLAQRLGRLAEHLRTIGFVADPTFLRTPEGEPVCPRHHVVMELREKQGDTWRSHHVKGPRGEDLYCKGHAGPDSPGWDTPIEGRGS